ncbi:MAG: ParB N-terminal domain-containing protein [Candidatus Nezhaarchaeales archaeon]
MKMIHYLTRLVEKDKELWDVAGAFLRLSVSPEDGTQVEKLEKVHTERVLVNAYRGLREWARENFLRWIKDHPPILEKYWTIEGPVYYPIDGNHRIAYARKLGLKMIPAKIVFEAFLPSKKKITIRCYRRFTDEELEVLKIILRLRGIREVLLLNFLGNPFSKMRI